MKPWTNRTCVAVGSVMLVGWVLSQFWLAYGIHRPLPFGVALPVGLAVCVIGAQILVTPARRSTRKLQAEITALIAEREAARREIFMRGLSGHFGPARAQQIMTAGDRSSSAVTGLAGKGGAE